MIWYDEDLKGQMKTNVWWGYLDPYPFQSKVPSEEYSDFQWKLREGESMIMKIYDNSYMSIEYICEKILDQRHTF